jgi:hypothetical protein
VARELRDDDDGALYSYIGRIVLDRCLVPPYVPRKALDRKSFPVHDACTYVFALQNLHNITACNVIDASLVPVTKDVIRAIRDAHLEKEAASLKKRHR